MSEVVVVVISRAMPGRGRDGLAAFAQLAAVTHTEEGCLTFALHRDPSDADRVVLVERWSSRAALDEHLTTAHLQDFRRDSAAIWAEPAVIMVLDPVAAGDPAKGMLAGA